MERLEGEPLASVLARGPLSVTRALALFEELPSSGAHAAPPARAGGSGAPWFAERKSTTERGRTPLAWAPTEAAPTQPPRRGATALAVRRRRGGRRGCGGRGCRGALDW